MKEEKKLNKAIKKGDKVLIISGNDKGMQGTVLHRTATKAVIQGVNVRKKHVRKTQENPQGGIVEIEKPVHISNVMLLGPEDKPIKTKVQVNQDGEREFVYKDGNSFKVLRKVK